MTTIPIVYRLTQGLFSLLNQEVDIATIRERGFAHAVLEAVAKRDHKNWEDLATEFRCRHGIPKGAGYGKESE